MSVSEEMWRGEARVEGWGGAGGADGAGLGGGEQEGGQREEGAQHGWTGGQD